MILNLTIFVLVVFVLITGVKLLLRKTLHIQKEKVPIFSYNHINDLHKKIDWGIRITTMIALIVTNALVIFENYSINLLLIPIFCIGLDYPVRAYFERKHSQNPKQYMLTLSEGVLMLLAAVIIIKFDFFM